MSLIAELFVRAWHGACHRKRRCAWAIATAEASRNSSLPGEKLDHREGHTTTRVQWGRAGLRSRHRFRTCLQKGKQKRCKTGILPRLCGGAPVGPFNCGSDAKEKVLVGAVTVKSNRGRTERYVLPSQPL